MNFWEFSSWGFFNLSAVLLASLLVANMLKRSIPVLQASLIPTSVLGGCLLLAANHGDRVCAALRAQGIPAAVIGVLTNKKDKTLCHDSTVSCLNRPKQDELDVFMEEHGAATLQ